MTVPGSSSFILRLMTFDLNSSSQVCLNHKLQIALRFLSIVVKWCLVATLIKKIKYYVLCVTGVYSTDITNMMFVILYLNVSRQCLLFLLSLVPSLVIPGELEQPSCSGNEFFFCHCHSHTWACPMPLPGYSVFCLWTNNKGKTAVDMN